MERIPQDLRRIIASSPNTASRWRDLTPIARRDFVSWIVSAKQAETRKRRIERVPGMLASGKRRPCCFAVVPMPLYRVLGTAPKAKAQWRGLSPDARRDFVDWIESAHGAGERQRRIERTRDKLAAGKRRP